MAAYHFIILGGMFISGAALILILDPAVEVFFTHGAELTTSEEAAEGMGYMETIWPGGMVLAFMLLGLFFVLFGTHAHRAGGAFQ